MVQAMAQYVAAREAHATAGRAAAAAARGGEGMRRRRPGATSGGGALSGGARRVPADSLEADGYGWDDDISSASALTQRLDNGGKGGNTRSSIDGGSKRSSGNSDAHSDTLNQHIGSTASSSASSNSSPPGGASVHATRLSTASPGDPVRLDDFGARLHGLEGADLDYLWTFVKARWTPLERIMVHMNRESMTEMPEVLSEQSPIFGITVGGGGGDGAAGSEQGGSGRAEGEAAAGAKGGGGGGGGKGGGGKKKRSGGGKKPGAGSGDGLDERVGGGGLGGGGGGGGKGEYHGRELCTDESDRALRLCVGAWQALYPNTSLDGVSVCNDPAAAAAAPRARTSEEAGPAAAAAAAAAVGGAAPVESFLGERLLNWVYSDHEEYSYVQLEEAVVRERSAADIAGLASKSVLLQGLLSTKLSVRRQVDNILTAAAAPSLVRRCTPTTA